jgi:hypothetical protein
MPVTSHIDPIGSTIKLMIDQTVSAQAQSRVFVAFIKGGIAAASETNRGAGITAAPVITVDGRKGASIDGVRPNGVVIAEWELVTPALRWIWDALRDRSPRFTGRYREGHHLFCDGREVEFGGDIPPAHRYVFTNVEPYSHKIEIGKTSSGRDFEINVPNRIYERVAAQAAAAFPGLDIEFNDAGKSPTITVTTRIA